MPSRFINKAALMTTNCFGAVTHTERRFNDDLSIAGHSMFLNCSSFYWLGLTGFNRRHKAYVTRVTTASSGTASSGTASSGTYTSTMG